MGPFNVQIRTGFSTLAAHLYNLYENYQLVERDLAEFHVQISPARLIKKPFSPYARFFLDGRSLFPPFPAEQALAALEWGINLAIATRINHLLLFHSAIVERNGYAVLLPAWPGSGKTTLCTALVHRGYRLFSDEFGLMDPGREIFLPLPRLMPLKNESIRVIRNYLPEATLGPEIRNTHKGTITHVRPPNESIARSGETAKANWIIFPKWVPYAPLRLDPLPGSEAFLLLASNSFNYEVLGETGFQAVTHLIRSCRCYKLIYSDFDAALTAMNALTDDI
ncbi:Hpr(Ser) kinase/phosphatase [Nitrosospira multiformis]|uniref:Hpr(Ser) kinase/phosphatase n=2 Tax=Nitrosospira multiformis TaxID=1231 RepID=A0A1H8M753_9PROT|nr:Hpr(Ser) kinase/phosphatase [Nitrosospira multiformis]